MATSASVQQRLTEILVQVVDCAPLEVIPAAKLGKDLGVDSLSIIEVCEKLGQDFGVYLTDETINSMVTVQDAVNAIIHHDHTTAGPRHPSQITAARAASGASSSSTTSDGSIFCHLTEDELEEKKRHAWRLVGGMAGAGLAIGLVLGIGGAALIDATGIKNIEPPPAASSSTTEPTASPTPSPTPTVAPTTAEPAESELRADEAAVSPGQQIVLSGTMAELGEGALLQVQIKDPDTDWDDFPVTTRTGKNGEFRTIVRTTRQGDRQFRMLHQESGDKTPAVTVTVG